jgi:2-polyprenyl-6-methoxyphenol hydroxylase-like FAD-dependent oxidoreductase
VPLVSRWPSNLARRGVSFRLIDKTEDPFRGSRGKGIQPRTQEIFEDIGIINRPVRLARLRHTFGM